MTKIIIVGAKGRMGQSLVRCGKQNKNLEIVGEIGKGDDLAKVIEKCDAVIDFSVHAATVAIAQLCAKHKKALIIGTTGFTEAEKKELKEITTQIPVVWATNFSTGVNALFWITRKAAEILGPDYDLEIVEMHHRLKKDAPSGTAESLAKILADVRKIQLEESLRFGRKGIVGERTATEIGMHSLRGGDVVGDNAVIFAGNGERLELAHKASSRDTFSNGALRAAQWIVGKKPGLYDMQDVLGLK